MIAGLTSHSIRLIAGIGAVAAIGSGFLADRPVASAQGRSTPILAPVQAKPASVDGLLDKSDLTYLGAFRVPAGRPDENSFDYASGLIAYHPANGTLLLKGHPWFQRLSELEIPRLSTGPNLETYATAAIRQPLSNPIGNKLALIGPGDRLIGGLLPWNGAMIVSAYIYYDANNDQVASHFRASLNLADTTAVTGPYQMGPGPRAGSVSGYMARIPVEWQSQLGGEAFTGNCCLSIISRTSFGPSISVFDPDDVGVTSPIPATTVLNYPQSQPLDRCEATSEMFNCTTMMGGVVFPSGTRSVLFFGRHGLGTYCYGDGGARGPCVDPANDSKGPHAYPYVYQVWAYDVLDLIAVKEGRKRPWDVRPYRTWSFDLPFQTPLRTLGVTYDATNGRIFIATPLADGWRPLIHVLSLSGGGQALPAPTPSPTLPAPPNPPHALNAVSSGSMVTLRWDNPSDGPVPTNHVIQTGSSSGLSDVAIIPTESTATIYTVQDMAPGRYYMRVLAANSAGTSGPSPEAVVLVGDDECSSVPGPPHLTGHLSNGAITLSWTDAPGATGYLLAAGTAPGLSDLVDTPPGSGSGATTAVYRATAGGTICLRIRAENACGPGPPSNEVVITYH